MNVAVTRSPFGSLVDSSAAALNLYKYGRKPFIFFAVGIAGSWLLISLLLNLKLVRGVSPEKPEWKEALTQLQTRISFLYRNLVYAGSFVLGVSQAVKKQRNMFDPDLGPVYLYGKLLVILLAVEFVCNVLLQPKKLKSPEPNPYISSGLGWLRSISRETSEQMIQGVATGFGFGYLIRGVGVLFEKY